MLHRITSIKTPLIYNTKLYTQLWLNWYWKCTYIFLINSLSTLVFEERWIGPKLKLFLVAISSPSQDTCDSKVMSTKKAKKWKSIFSSLFYVSCTIWGWYSNFCRPFKSVNFFQDMAKRKRMVYVHNNQFQNLFPNLGKF